MGCDIHAHLEIKLDGKWEHYSIPKINANYELFEFLAGVRAGYNQEDIEPLSMPRGLPEDITRVTAYEARWMGDDGHSFSWIDSHEIRKMFDFMKKLGVEGHSQVGLLVGNRWNYFHEYREDYPGEIEDIRMVFWFDN